jgi:DNA-binding helix-hairpin-helix protein with protein kinase domain
VNFLTQAGYRIELASRSLGHGGQGAVFPVVGEPHLVAKIYHQPTLEHWEKLHFMVANPVPQIAGHFWVTWPIGIIFTDTQSPSFAGYLMPKLTRAKSIFNYYNPATRQKKFPGLDYRYLVRCARNLASAFSLAHSHGHIIGDANESNVFAGNDARVSLIDVDSWQIADAGRGRFYRSPVAKADFLPPELQSKNLKDHTRQPCHDNFALAVLLFKLLFEGNHPFDGIYHGPGDAPKLEARIASGDLPLNDRSGRWSPKALSLPLDALHPHLQNLFWRAFVTGHTRPQSRPTANEWHSAFAEVEPSLQACRSNPNHWFWGHQCVWCQRKNIMGGLDPFPGGNLISKLKTVVAANIPQRPPPKVELPVNPSAAPAPATSQSNGHSWLTSRINRALRAMKETVEYVRKFFS